MFKIKKYTLRFKKYYKYVSQGVWYEVTDNYLMSVLLELQSKYNFEIISTNFHNCFGYSHIKIKCNKKDYPCIWQDYCERVDEYITDISF